MLHVTCHVSCFMRHVSCVTCNVLPVTNANSRLRQFGSTTDFVSYLVGFLIHLSPYFKNFFRFPICRYWNHVGKILTVRNRLIVKIFKIFPNVVFDSLNWAFWDPECNAKKPQPSRKHLSWKNQEKLPEISRF